MRRFPLTWGIQGRKRCAWQRSRPDPNWRIPGSNLAVARWPPRRCGLETKRGGKVVFFLEGTTIAARFLMEDSPSWCHARKKEEHSKKTNRDGHPFILHLWSFSVTIKGRMYNKRDIHKNVCLNSPSSNGLRRFVASCGAHNFETPLIYQERQNCRLSSECNFIHDDSQHRQKGEDQYRVCYPVV